MPQPFVLNVDADEATRNTFAHILRDQELCLREASDARQALEFAAELDPAVVVVAPEVAGASGLQLCQELAKRCTAGKILRTRRGADAAAESQTSADVDLLLTDPVSPEALTAAVRTLVRLKTAEREERALTAELAAARSEINMMISRVGHDFSEAVRAVSTLLELIRQGGQHRLSSAESSYMVHVDAAVDRSKHLVQSLMSYAQIGREAASLRRDFDLEGAFWAAQAQVRPLLDETGGILEKTGPLPRVFGNPARLQQLFVCLLTNALRYRRPNTTPEIRVTAEPETEGFWKIAVSDNGPGIGAEHHEAVFTPFHRLHGREIPGAGMGLAIGRRIVEATGGRLWVESEPERGATFAFTLPGAKQ